MGGITCEACGQEYLDVAVLRKAGWHAAGVNGAECQVECGQCRALIVVERLTDASFCTGCGRLLHDEPKVVAESTGVLCEACARRGGIGAAKALVPSI